MLAALTALLLAAASPPAEVPSAIFVHRSGSGGASVWRVHADGRTERLPGEFPEAAGGIAYLGTSYPVPSPDGRHLAYIGGGQIRVRDLRSGEERAITALDDPQSKYRLHITHWSADSRQLLYHMRAPLPPPSEDGCGRPGDVRPVEYRIHELEAGKDRRLRPPPALAVAAWLPDGSFLVVPPIGREGAWGSWSEGEESVRPLTGQPGRFSQFAPNAAAGKVMALWHGGPDEMTRIVSVDLADGVVENHSPPSRFAGIQWASLSPAGTRAAWIRRASVGAAAQTLMSEDRTLLECSEWIPVYVWVGDGAIAAQCKGELLVVGVEEAKVLSRTPLPGRC